MGTLNLSPLRIAGAFEVVSQLRSDIRGSFTKLFCHEQLQSALDDAPLCQINLSVTTSPGAIRGMHYQRKPYAEHKLVRCLQGAVFDVVVDLRAGSSTFLQWEARTLESASQALLIPPGCAHGFQVLEAPATLLYAHTATYAPDFEGGVRFDDPRIGIQWPLRPAEISERDGSFAWLTEEFRGVPL